ncbi:hypothetical protein JCM11641_007880 [Rhodosporidiobolus odoratus]
MNILSESETRSFSQFLDSFADSPSSRPPSTASATPSQPFSGVPQPPDPAFGRLAGIGRLSDVGGIAPLGGWAPPGGLRRAQPRLQGRSSQISSAPYGGMTGSELEGSAGAKPAPFPPHPAFSQPYYASSPDHSTLTMPPAQPYPVAPQTHSLPSSSRHVLHSSASFASPLPLGFSPLSSSYPPASASSARPVKSSAIEHQRRARMAQQAAELEAMLGQRHNGEIEEQEEESLDSPPVKRAKNGEGWSVRDTVPLVQEREAGQHLPSAVSGTTASVSPVNTFAPPAPAPSSPRTRTSARIGSGDPLPLSAVTQKRKAPASMSKRQTGRSASTLEVEAEDDAAPSSNSNPGPARTPSIIPLAPNRTTIPRTSYRSTFNLSPSPPTPAASTSTNGGKPAPLTAAQKKANHIASEQKRRTSIRAGYDKLSLVVPTLHAAVEEYEARLAAASRGGGSGGGKRGKVKGETKMGALMGGIEIGGEKVDGRAGPKSEAVVLSKTVEHLRDLLSRRAALLSRLSDAHALAEERSVDLSAVPPAGAPRAPQIAGEWDEPWEGWMEEGILMALGLAQGGEGTKGNALKAEDGEEEYE